MMALKKSISYWVLIQNKSTNDENLMCDEKFEQKICIVEKNMLALA